MDAVATRLAIANQLERLRQLGGLVATYGWDVDHREDQITVLVRLGPRSRPALRFTVRLGCDDYPERAPSLQFTDPSGTGTGAEFWPDQGSAFPAAVSRDRNVPQLCIPGIREFHEGCHRGDTGKPWRPELYGFARVLEAVQVLLDEAYP